MLIALLCCAAVYVAIGAVLAWLATKGRNPKDPAGYGVFIIFGWPLVLLYGWTDPEDRRGKG